MNNKKDFLKVTVYAAVFGLIGGVSFQGANYVSDQMKKPSAVESQAQTDTQTSSNTSGILNATAVSGSSVTAVGDVSKVADKVLPSIVAINVKATVSQSDVFGRSYSSQEEGSGSGIILSKTDSEILIATNNHVVDGANTVSVVFNDGNSVKAAVKGTDSTSDLAVVSVKPSDVKADTLSVISVAEVGDSGNVKVGEQAIAIGNALGYGTSVTVGYISAKDRTISVEDSSMKLLQTDAAINPGNSGGALVNSEGQVIGINSAKFASTEVEGMGFAIPISTAVPIIKELETRQEVSEADQAYLGVVGQDVTSDYAEAYNLPIGIYVQKVEDNSPAAKAGLKQGDIITGINGKTVKTLAQLSEDMKYCKSGQEGKLTVKTADQGNYTEHELTVTFGSKSQSKSN